MSLKVEQNKAYAKETKIGDFNQKPKKTQQNEEMSAIIQYLWWIADSVEQLNLTGSATLITFNLKGGEKVKVLVDYWMSQWCHWADKFNEYIHPELLDVDFLIITHGHMDHIWKVVQLIKA